MRRRLSQLEALVRAQVEIAKRVSAMPPDERQKLKRQLEGQIQGELLGTRGQASQLRRLKRAVTLACIESA